MATYTDTVRDDHGNAIVGAQVYVYDFSGNAVTTAISGAGGSFSFTAPDGFYPLETHANGKVVHTYAVVGDAAVAFRGLPGAPGLISINGLQFYTPEQFGAVGNGTTSDQAAFEAMSAALQTAGGGVVQLRAGATYRIFRQAPADPLAYYAGGFGPIDLTGIGTFILFMNGATFKAIDGMKVGSFNPANGAVYNPSMPFTTIQYLAYQGSAIRVTGAKRVRIYDGKIDLNCQKAVLGGLWGDTGRQAPGFGINLTNVEDVEVDGVEIRNATEDCLSYGYTLSSTTDTRHPATFRNCRFDVAARNCVSVLGGRGIRFENCLFRYGGSAPNDALGTTYHTAPGSCIDVEAEFGPIRAASFVDCDFIGNPTDTETCFVADSGDTDGIDFDNCAFNGAVWTSRAFTRFRNSRISGRLARVMPRSFLPTQPESWTQFIGCTIDDTIADPADTGALFVDCINTDGGPIFTSCRFIITRRLTDFTGTTMRGECSILYTLGTPTAVNQSNPIKLDNADIERLTITEAIASGVRPANAYYVSLGTAKIKGTLVSPNSKLYWNNWNPAAGGRLGDIQLPHEDLWGSVTVDLASIANGASSTTITIPVTNATLGDVVAGISASAALPTGVTVSQMQVSAAGTVTAVLYNGTGSAYDPPSLTFRAKVTKQ